ncbi:MAG: hypothetical protein AAF975_06780 [Spirochaetota bacterium]
MKSIDYLVYVEKIPQDLVAALQDQAHELHQTAKVYAKLLDSNLLWRIWAVDPYGKLWLEVNFINEDGEEEFHTIALDEGTYRKIDFERYKIFSV